MRQTRETGRLKWLLLVVSGAVGVVLGSTAAGSRSTVPEDPGVPPVPPGVLASTGHDTQPASAQPGPSGAPRGMPPPRFQREFLAVPRPNFDRSQNLGDLYDAETRNPLWAPKMESVMRKRFEAAKIEALGLTGLSFREVECRESTCRIQVEWTGDLARSVVPPPEVGPEKSRRLTPLQAYVRTAGPFGAVVATMSKEYLRDGGERRELVVAHSERTIDPQTFDTWVEAMNERRRLARSHKGDRK